MTQAQQPREESTFRWLWRFGLVRSVLAIGFIGVGQMGEGMCRRLLAAGYPLAVLAHRNRAPVERLVAGGATEAASAAAVAAASRVVILCVSNADVVEQTVEAMRPALARGKIIIDTSTSAPELSTGVMYCEKSPAPSGVRTAAVVFQPRASVYFLIEPSCDQPQV